MLTKRGDPKSRAVIALAIACDVAFWAFLVLAPIGVLILAVREGWRGILVLAILACPVAAFIAKALSRGIWSGHRIAYIAIWLLVLGACGFHIWISLTTTSATAVLAASRAIVYFCMAALVALMAIRPRSIT